MDQARPALLHDGPRHLKGLVGVLDRWVAMQKSKVPPPSQAVARRKGL
jgi:hypothetical protein